jgi:hypothetical protein
MYIGSFDKKKKINNIIVGISLYLFGEKKLMQTTQPSIIETINPVKNIKYSTG